MLCGSEFDLRILNYERMLGTHFIRDSPLTDLTHASLGLISEYGSRDPLHSEFAIRGSRLKAPARPLSEFQTILLGAHPLTYEMRRRVIL